MNITKFANAITVVSNDYFSVSESSTASSTFSANKPNLATVIASTRSQKAAISKMNKLLKKHNLENTQSTSVTTYKLTGSPQTTWTGISISGKNAIACVTDYAYAANNHIYYSSDGGINWSTSNATTYQWSSVSISDSYALASNLNPSKANSFNLFYSTDGGISWTSNNEQDPIINVTLNGTNAIKAIGQKKLIYYTKNANTQPISWTESSTPISSYTTVVSNSGSNAVLCGDTNIYYSNDSGQTWNISNSPTTNWLSVSISGAYAVACDESSESPYYSSDYGATWYKSKTLTSYCTCVSISGSNAVAGGNGGKIYYSNNYGATWQISTSDQATWWHISIDGANAVACVYDGYIYYSSNYGASWTQS